MSELNLNAEVDFSKMFEESEKEHFKKADGVVITDEELLKINSFIGIPIIDRDINWYFGIGIDVKIPEKVRKIYKRAIQLFLPLNDNEVCKTEGLLSVERYIKHHIINSEKSEFMLEIAEADSAILSELVYKGLVKRRG